MSNRSERKVVVAGIENWSVAQDAMWPRASVLPFVTTGYCSQKVEKYMATESLRGLLKFVADEAKHGMIYLCLLLDGETQPKNAKGYRPLRSFILTKSATAVFLEEFGEEIMDGDLVDVEVVTEQLSQDLADNKGLKGYPPFKCVSLTLAASQSAATPSSAGKL